MINALDGHVCVVSRDGVILRTNRRWSLALAAAGPQQPSGEVGDRFFPFCAPGAPILGDLAGEVASIMSEVLRSGGDDRSVKRRIDVKGEPQWVIARIRPVPDLGQAGAVLSVIDITEGMRVQEQLRDVTSQAQTLAQALADEKALLGDVLSTIPHLVYWKDRAGHYLGCNDAFATFRGLSDRSILGQAEPDLDADDQLGATLTQLEGQVMADGRPVLNHKTTVSDSTGSPRTMLLSVLPQRRSLTAAETTDPGEGIIGVGADVTLISELERQLAQANRLEAIGQLAAGIAHEINTPIQYIADNTRFVADSLAAVLDTLRTPTAPTETDLDFLQEEIPRALAESMEGLQRVADIVRAMKDFSHPGQALEDTDLNRAIETTVQISRNEWKHTAVMDLHLDPGTGYIPCYPGELKQALLNIVVNAARAITQHRDRTHQTAPGTITIRTRRTDEHVTITIADDGAGMDETIQARIFDPFFTTKDVGKGTGQGLALAHATIVQKHAGAIAVESAPGHGSTFTITLPTTGPPPSTVAPPSEPPTPG